MSPRRKNGPTDRDLMAIENGDASVGELPELDVCGLKSLPDDSGYPARDNIKPREKNPINYLMELEDPNRVFKLGLKYLGLEDIASRLIAVLDQESLLKFDRTFRKLFESRKFRPVDEGVKKNHTSWIVDIFKVLLDADPCLEKAKIAKDIYTRFDSLSGRLMEIVKKRMNVCLQNGLYDEAFSIQSEFDLKLPTDERGLSRFAANASKGVLESIWMNKMKCNDTDCARDDWFLRPEDDLSCGLKCWIEAGKVTRTQIEKILGANTSSMVSEIRLLLRRNPPYDCCLVALEASWHDIGLRDVLIEEMIYYLGKDWEAHVDPFWFCKKKLGITPDEMAKHPDFEILILKRIKRVLTENRYTDVTDNFFESIRFFVDKYGIDIRKMEDYEKIIRKAFKSLVEKGDYESAIKLEKLFGEELDLKETSDYKLLERQLKLRSGKDK